MRTNGNTSDRRTQRTKKAIITALAELLTEKDLHKITVQEIADKVDMNRATFYNHYLDVYDLYDKLEESILIDMGLLMLQLQDMPANEAFSQLIDYVADNRILFQMIFNSNASGKLQGKTAQLIEGLFRQMQSELKTDGIHDKRLAYISCYRAHGCLAILEKWVNSGLSEPKDFIIRTVSEFDQNTVRLLTEQHKP